jgi:hypothetical protein
MTRLGEDTRGTTVPQGTVVTTVTLVTMGSRRALRVRGWPALRGLWQRAWEACADLQGGPDWLAPGGLAGRRTLAWIIHDGITARSGLILMRRVSPIAVTRRARGPFRTSNRLNLPSFASMCAHGARRGVPRARVAIGRGRAPRGGSGRVGAHAEPDRELREDVGQTERARQGDDDATDTLAHLRGHLQETQNSRSRTLLRTSCWRWATRRACLATGPTAAWTSSRIGTKRLRAADHQDAREEHRGRHRKSCRLGALR